MKSVKFGRSVSACELDCQTLNGCPNLCGMCPPCAFAPKPPGTTQCVWKVSDDFKRRFVVELILRSKDTKVLENIHSILGVTSWTLFTYARSKPRGPTSPPKDYFAYRSDVTEHRALDGRPRGLDVNEIWDWFSRSPDWIRSRYLCRLFSLCDAELLRMVANLTSVLLVRQKRGFLQFNVSSRNTYRHNQGSDEDSEDPALMVVPGSSKSVSGVSRYRDFIGGLPVDLSKRILGLLDERTLKRCQKVCRYWSHLAKETMEEFKFRRIFQDQIKAMMKRCEGINIVSPTYANIVEVPVPVKDAEDEENEDILSSVQKVETFEAAYNKIRTKMVQMEERNVYCGAFFTTVLLDKEDPHRVMDYSGGTLMATGSKDRMVNLFYVGSETKVISVMKGHVSSVRAVLLCLDRDLVITGSCDTSIRCWNVKTDKCVMALYGHTGVVNCLDVHGDKLVSGAKDCLVKVWSLITGKHFEDLNFKHPSSVQCVKIDTKTVYSSSDRGLIKIWDMGNASLLRVIDAHKSSVRYLFFDEWHLLSGDSSGQVMAWSTNWGAKQCLMTFNHPKEVKSLTLVYLRVVTGCADGKIRIFNFLTGDCLREITAEAETGRILSMHFHENCILVNSTSSVKRFQFAKVFWDPIDAGEGDGSEKPAASLRRTPVTDRTAQVASPRGKKLQDCDNKKPRRAESLYHPRFLSTPARQARERSAKQSVVLSEKATSERVKRRGLHHPMTRDSILLRVNAVQKAQCMDEVSINMECNARLRDSWGPRTFQDILHPDTQIYPHEGQPRRPKTCVPTLKRAVSQNRSSAIQHKAQPHSADTHRASKRASGTRSLPNSEFSMRTSTSLPRISPAGPLKRAGGIQAAHGDPAGRLCPSRRGSHAEL